MAILDLSNQSKVKTSVQTLSEEISGAMGARKAVWDKIPFEKRKQWVLNEKDPVMVEIYAMYLYLKNNFFEGLK